MANGIMAGRTIAIGDIHGCDVALDALLRLIAPTPEDLLITLGDYIDRGPNSRAVIQRLLKLSDHCRLVPLIGNHEIMMLTSREMPEQFDHWLAYGGEDTLASYDLNIADLDDDLDVFDAIPQEHMQFIDDCDSFYETNDFLFFHANYVANLPPDRQPEFTIFWEHLSLYVPEPHVSGKTAIVGHTPQIDGDILDLGHVICIDTHCFGGGWLTALEVTSRKVWQANQEGEIRELTLQNEY